jgi:DNA-binding XRE family transcriptional regulator
MSFSTAVAVLYLTRASQSHKYCPDSNFMENGMPKVIKKMPAPVQSGPLDAETLGRFVRARRTQSGLGMHEAAAFCGVAVDTLSKIETARGDVKLSSILTVCRMLGIHLIVEPWEE